MQRAGILDKGNNKLRDLFPLCQLDLSHATSIKT